MFVHKEISQISSRQKSLVKANLFGQNRNILSYQPNIKKERTSVYISRHIEKTVMELNDQYPVILLTGPRQVGKTTMLEHLMKAEGGGHSGIPGRPGGSASSFTAFPERDYELHRRRTISPGSASVAETVEEPHGRSTTGELPMTRRLTRPVGAVLKQLWKVP